MLRAKKKKIFLHKHHKSRVYRYMKNKNNKRIWPGLLLFLQHQFTHWLLIIGLFQWWFFFGHEIWMKILPVTFIIIIIIMNEWMNEMDKWKIILIHSIYIGFNVAESLLVLSFIQYCKIEIWDCPTRIFQFEFSLYIVYFSRISFCFQFFCSKNKTLYHWLHGFCLPTNRYFLFFLVFSNFWLNELIYISTIKQPYNQHKKKKLKTCFLFFIKVQVQKWR